MSSNTSSNCTSPWCPPWVFHWQILTIICSAWSYFHILPFNSTMTLLIMPPPHDSFLSACSCPGLVLHSGLQPFHSYCRVEAPSYTDFYFVYMCLKDFSIVIASATIDAGGTVHRAFLTTTEFLLPQNFLFICLSFPAFFCVFVPAKNLAYIYSFSLSVYTVYDVSCFTLLEHSCHVCQAYS